MRRPEGGSRTAAGLSSPTQAWNLTAYVDDLFNDQFRADAILGNLPGQDAARLSEPRIFGLQGRLDC